MTVRTGTHRLYGTDYFVLGEAVHSETGKMLVLYAATDEDSPVVRAEPLSDFFNNKHKCILGKQRRDAIKRGVYEHFKSTPEHPKRYLVTGEAVSPKTGEALVLYVPLCGAFTVMARPADMFNELVSRPESGYYGPRFRYVGE